MGCLGASWELHEDYWEPLGSLLGALGSVLGASWERLKKVLEAFWRHLGAVWMVFWSLGIVFEAISCNIENLEFQWRVLQKSRSRESEIYEKISLEG